MNKLNLDFDPINVAGITCAKLILENGSSSDPDKKKGGHQLLGSLLTRGCGQFNNIEFAKLVENTGACLRCDTYEDGILISLKCASEDSVKLIELLGWMLKDPHFEQTQINLEKDLTIKALIRQKENPYYLAFEGWRKIAYGNGPYGHDPLGEIDDINNINKSDLDSLLKKIKNKNRFLVIGGEYQPNLKKKISEMESFKLEDHLITIEKSFTNFETIKKRKTNKLDDRIISIEADIEQIIIIFGQPTIPYWNKNDLGLRILHSHLSFGMSSILFQRLREQKGLAYEVGAIHPTRLLESPFIIHASSCEGKALATLQLINEIWWDLSNKLLTQQEIDLSISKFKGQLAHGSQTSSQRAERIAQLRRLNLPYNYDKLMINKMESIAPEEIKEISRLYLRKPLLSLCGPNKGIESLKKYWENLHS